MIKATISVMTVLFCLLPVYSAEADATGVNYRLMTGKSSLTSDLCESVTQRLAVEFSKEVKNIITDTDIETMQRFGEQKNLAAKAYSAAQIEIIATIDQTKRKTGKRWKGDYFIKVEVIKVATKKKLFEEIINLGPSKRKGWLEPDVYLAGCTKIAKKVVARLKKMPSPVKGKHGPVSPLPKRLLPKLDPVVNCGHGKLEGMERLGRFYIEGAGLILENSDSSCLTIRDEIKTHLHKNKKKIEAILKESRAEILSAGAEKILACRRRIQNRVYEVSLGYLKRCKNQHSLVFKSLGVLIYPEVTKR
jgi:hypothetical protein